MHSLTLDKDDLDLCKRLDTLRLMTNGHSNQRHALQGRTYGKVEEALLEALAVGFIGPDRLSPSDEEWDYARQLANLIHYILLDSGVEVPEALEIAHKNYWCEDCSMFHFGYCDARVKTHVATYGREVMGSGRCLHGFSIHSRCPRGCDEEPGGINEKETGWTGR